MRFGSFDNKDKEYVIDKPNTPLPWINYLGCDEYCALISNTAGGYSFHVDPRDQRILRYRYDNIPFDRGGRYLYIRDDKTGKFFSPTYQPVGKLDKYECRHGLGYTTISSTYNNIETEIAYFVPLGENLEVWNVEIHNTGRGVRNLSMFSFVEFCQWNAVEDMSNFQRTWSTAQAHCEGSTIYHDTLYGSWRNIFAYFSSSAKINSFDCQSKAFFGDHGFEAPEAVVKGKCSDSVANGWTPVGAHCVKLKLKPGEKKTVVFVLGVADEKSKLQNKIKKFQNPKVVEKELQKLKDYWEENLSKLQIETPDEEMNTSINIWNSYQCMQTFNWSRYASYYEAGIGRGMGFRDCCQDTLGFGHMIPEKVRARLLDLAAIQFEDGSAHHQYSPITKKGFLYNYADDHLWLILATANYIKETGDYNILDEEVIFAEREEFVAAPMGHYDKAAISNQQSVISSKTKTAKGTFYEHLRRGIDYTWQNRGEHGLPLSLFSDWNDCLNLDEGGESVFVAMLFVSACNEMVKMMESRGQTAEIRKYKDLADRMTHIANSKAWDGKWYKRAYNGDGKPVGSKECSEGKIFLEPQPWAIISGVAHGKRATATMDAVKRRLSTRFGIKLLSPAFTEYHPEYGEITTYPKGLKENASIFCHPNPWAMVAECLLGRGNQAYKYYRAILPGAQNEIADTRRTEPYVYCQMVAGPDHPDFGEGKNSWLTGSAAWNYVAATQYMLGIQPDYNGLVIDPCIPKKWKKFSVKRVLRGDTYIINVVNPAHVEKGVKFLTVDGRRIKDKIIPYFRDGKEHLVEVVMG